MSEEPKKNLHKGIAYTMKYEQEITRQKNQKILRVLRAHENRLVRIEKNLGITPSDKEMYDLSNTDPEEKDEIKRDGIPVD